MTAVQTLVLFSNTKSSWSSNLVRRAVYEATRTGAEISVVSVDTNCRSVAIVLTDQTFVLH